MSVKNKGVMRKNILRKEDAEKLLAPWLDTFIEAANQGLALFATFTPDQLADMNHRAKMANLNSYVTAALTRLLDKEPGVAPDFEYEGPMWIFDGRLAMRCKHLTRADRTCNHPSGRQKQIDCQILQLPGIDCLTVASFGYRVDELFRSYEEMKVVCWRDDERVWTIPLVVGPQPVLKDFQAAASEQEFWQPSTVRSADAPAAVVKEGSGA